jgi:general secretion pathway protein D
MPMFLRLFLILFSVLFMAGCAGWKLHSDGMAMISKGKIEVGIDSLKQAALAEPSNPQYRLDWVREREQYIERNLAVAREELALDRAEVARQALQRVLAMDSVNARAKELDAAAIAQLKHKQGVVRAQLFVESANWTAAQEILVGILSESPKHAGALALQAIVQQGSARLSGGDGLPTLKTSINLPITLSVRDAPLLQVFDAMRQLSKINFVFDRDVRQDQTITIALTEKPIAEALKIISQTQKLESRVLDNDTIYIFPNTPEKQRENESLVVKLFYLSNSDASKTVSLVKQFSSAREVYVDERLNVLVVKDQPEGLRVVEKLLSTLDVPEAEVMLELEVLEVSTNRLLDLGIRWPDTISANVQAPASAGLSSALGVLTLPQLRAANSSFVQLQLPSPLVAVNLRQSDGDVTVLANPRVRIKNRATAKILVGERVPVITTSTTANVGSSESVSYLDVGLKLELEPTISLENDVSMKVALEVSSITGEVVRASGLQAFRLGTRNAATTLRVKDGETQVLAGLIQKDERVAANRVPGLGSIPLLGRLFSRNSDSEARSEIVLLITPRVVRSIVVPGSSRTEFSLPNSASNSSSNTRLPTQSPSTAPSSNFSFPNRPQAVIPQAPNIRPIPPVVPTQPPAGSVTVPPLVPTKPE